MQLAMCESTFPAPQLADTYFAALKLSKYFRREGRSSAGRLSGVHTGSPTNSRIACQARFDALRDLGK